ncbi:DJ-1/PfpI family protein [Micromonospora sp. DT31]|uniref:DJ-1/PfpI family protein n=1 Tax=Micromonospora sp. DT31 TaxID=3393434 RepID=UPI003CF4F60A
MWSVEHSVDTAAAPAEVWAFYADTSSWSAWNTAVAEVSLDGPFRAGATGTLTPPGAGPLPLRIVEAEPERGYVSETAIADTVSLRTTCRLAPAPRGGTRITHRVELVGPAAPHFAQSFGPVLAAGVPRTVEALAARAGHPARRAVIVLTSHDTLGDTGRSTGAYLSEVAEAWQVFDDAGLRVELVSVRGGRPPLEAVNEQDPVQRQFLADARMAEQLAATPSTAEVSAHDCAILFVAGGHGAVWDLPYDKELAALVRDVHEAGGVVASVCHGPAALLEVTLSDGTPLLRGRQVTGFSNDEERAVGMTTIVPFSLADALAARGARYASAGAFLPHVVTDGRLVTGQNPASATAVARAAIDAL